MNVCWFSTRDYEAMEGGAEAADKDMWGQAPEDVEITLTNDVDQVMHGGWDKVVVSSLRGLSPQQIAALALTKPAIWVHDEEHTGHWIYAKANPLVCLTPQHAQREAEKNKRIGTVLVNPGWFDTSPIHATDYGARMEQALWAHRPAQSKGLDRASDWAREKGIPLIVRTNDSKEAVYWDMAMSRYFILLSWIFDPGPRAVIEAQIAGCELILDDVGHFDVGPDEMRELIDGAGKAFWEMVLQ